MRDLLLSRDYKPRIIDAAINTAKNIPQTEALRKVQTIKANKRPVFVVTYDPRLPSITGIIQKHWRTMVKYPQLKEVFPEPPLVA